jgi:DNA polymerase III subunit beta
MSKATVERAALKDALAVLTKVGFAKSRIPVLTQVKLSVNGDVRLSATDLEVAARFRLARAERGGEFQALLPTARLAEYVRTSTYERTVFEPQDEFTTRLDGSSATLVGLSVADFPEVIGEEGEPWAEFNAGEFAEALRNVLPSVSREVIRYALTGVLLEIKGKSAALVSSDGKRLSAARIKPENGKPCRFIIPLKTAELLERIAGKAGDAKVEVLVAWIAGSEKPEVKGLHFRIGNADVYSREIVGHFPDWEAVVPAGLTEVFSFDRKALTVELARVAQACTDKTQAVKFTFGGGTCELYTKTQDVAEARGVVGVDGKGAVSTVFNPLYVLDYLKALPKSVKRVTLKLRDKASAGLFQGAKGHDYIVMPLTITL